MYVSDTLAGCVLAYDVDDSGALSGRRVFARIADAEGVPDGLAVDAEGGLWAAHWGGSRISRWAPDGGRSETVAIPTTNVTSLAFGGPGLGTLFVTTASDPYGGEPVEPGSGALYALEPGVAGVLDWPCSLGVV
jgi:sugar lactone lactonase YvrE